MADLPNDSGSLRFALTLAGRDAGRWLASAALEYHDRRDGEWWPFVRLPVVHLGATALDELLAGLAAVVAGSQQGVAWRAGDDAPVGLQLGAVPGGAVVEVGLDLSLFLAESAGVPPRPNAELALFRFRALQPGLVRFSDALAREREGLDT
jgi:hypothetical protein